MSQGIAGMGYGNMCMQPHPPENVFEHMKLRLTQVERELREMAEKRPLLESEQIRLAAALEAAGIRR